MLYIFILYRLQIIHKNQRKRDFQFEKGRALWEGLEGVKGREK